jgi:hypothetical protein
MASSRTTASPVFGAAQPTGEECDACETVIRAEELLMEAISTLTNQGIQLHVECFYLWDLERVVPRRE